ncbi:MAG: ribosomal protein S18-alanine N-acetyltransferase [Terracidiphilus sp.]|jgi:ribosomal-protein-alanine N-acetyltransferase
MTPADLDRVIEVDQSLAEAPHWPRAAYLAALDTQATLPRIALVIESPGHSLAGFAVASLIPPQAELETIAVAQEHQHQGLARALFVALAAELRRAGIAEVALELRTSNLPAQALYRRLGFGQTGHRPRYYVDPVEDALLLTLKL